MDSETLRIKSSTDGDDVEYCHQQLIKNFTEIYSVEEWKMNGFFDDSDLLNINCHWMEFKPVGPFIHFTMSIIYTIVLFVGFFSNAFVIYIIFCSKKLLTPANILLVNLAISDLLSVLTIPVFIFNSLHQGPAIGKLGCSLYGFLSGFAGTCAIMSLTAVSVERYLVISRPFNLDRRPTRSWAYFVSLLTWLYSALFASLPLFGVGDYVPDGYLTGCSFDYLSKDLTTKIFILIFLLGAWMVPMIVILYSYLSIILCVAESRRSVAYIAGNNEIIINQPNNVEMKVVRNVLGLILGWTLSWTPYAIVALIGISGHGHLLTPLGAMIPALFTKLAACIEPFIYAFNQPSIQREIRRRFFRVPVHQTNWPIINNNITTQARSSGRTRARNRCNTSAPLNNIHQQWQITSL